MLKFCPLLSRSFVLFSIWFNWIGTEEKNRAQLVDRVNTRPTDVHCSWNTSDEEGEKEKWKWHLSLSLSPAVVRFFSTRSLSLSLSFCSFPLSLSRFFLSGTRVNGWDSGALMYFSSLTESSNKCSQKTRLCIRAETSSIAQLCNGPRKKALTFLSNDMDRWTAVLPFHINRLLTRAEWTVPMHWLMLRRQRRSRARRRSAVSSVHLSPPKDVQSSPSVRVLSFIQICTR